MTEWWWSQEYARQRPMDFPDLRNGSRCVVLRQPDPAASPSRQKTDRIVIYSGSKAESCWKR